MDEAERIFHSIFRTSIPDLLKKRFHDASKILSAAYTQAEIAEYNRALKRISDLEAVELIGRRKKKIPLLVMKFHLMIYLAETVPECRDYYINRFDTKTTGWIFLFMSGWRTVIKFIKGLFLVKAFKI